MERIQSFGSVLFYYPLRGSLLGVAGSLVIWFVLHRNWQENRTWKRWNVTFSILSVLLIYFYTVYGREPSDEHQLVFFAPMSDEFYREMFMNALLFYPLGLSLTVVAGKKAILWAFLFSFSIEAWQYFAGTGMAQGTDLICNTLGCAVGAMPVLLANRWYKKNKHSEGTQ